MAQLSFLSIALNRKLHCEKFLDEMLKVVPWAVLVAEIKPYYTSKQSVDSCLVPSNNGQDSDKKVLGYF